MNEKHRKVGSTVLLTLGGGVNVLALAYSVGGRATQLDDLKSRVAANEAVITKIKETTDERWDRIKGDLGDLKVQLGRIEERIRRK